jgi:arylsulfatase A-like enzyme
VRIVRRLFSAVTVALVVAGAGCHRDVALPRCPDCNIVLISVDTLRADHVGAYGYSRPVTPNIDALARRGVVFDDAIAQSSWTRAAHMSIMTGLYPREHGFIALRDTRRLDTGVPTIASTLADHGWTTAGYSGGINMAASFGFNQGFEVYRNNGRYFRDNFEDARFWLDRNQKKKFFLFFHGYDAHTPYHADDIDRAAIGLTRPAPRFPMKRACRKHHPSPKMDLFMDEYDAAIHRADRYVGKLVAELESRGLMDHTILVLLSDHGEEFLEHGRCFHVSTLHREVLHVPLIVVAPGLEPRHVPGLVAASVTIAPTLMELAGISPQPFPGPSLLAAAAGAGTTGDVVISETEKATVTGGDGLVRSLSREDLKLIDWPTLGRTALYDVRRDLAERTPLTPMAEEGALAGDLRHWTDAHPPRFEPRRRGRGTAPAKDEKLRKREEQLRSFGYVN